VSLDVYLNECLCAFLWFFFFPPLSQKSLSGSKIQNKIWFEPGVNSTFRNVKITEHFWRGKGWNVLEEKWSNWNRTPTQQYCDSKEPFSMNLLFAFTVSHWSLVPVHSNIAPVLNPAQHFPLRIHRQSLISGPCLQQYCEGTEPCSTFSSSNSPSVTDQWTQYTAILRLYWTLLNNFLFEITISHSPVTRIHKTNLALLNCTAKFYRIVRYQF
jgi:hypothetical protein